MSQNQILMVDNSVATAKIISRLIEKKLDNCFVTTCHTGQEALELANERPFNLITSSLMLPDIDGISLVKKLRQKKQYKDTPFIIVSGDADERIQSEGFDAGVTGYFDKANGHKPLIQYIDSLLPKRESFHAKVLYIEDSKTVALKVTRLLHSHGIKVVHTDSAEHAFELLSARSAPEDPVFDLVVTDITLKGEMNGYELVRNIRGRLHYSATDLPVLVVSGTEDNIASIFSCGANDFITKPVSDELLCTRLKALLAIRDQNKLKQLEENIKKILSS